MSVRRDKYDKAKSAAITWHNLLAESKQRIEELEKQNKQSNEEVNRWKKLSEVLPDQNTFEELELENKKNLKTVKDLKKQLCETEEKYKDKIAQLEREKILHEGRIQHLEEAKKDLQDRYNELRQDMREQRLNFMSKVDKN